MLNRMGSYSMNAEPSKPVVDRYQKRNFSIVIVSSVKAYISMGSYSMDTKPSKTSEYDQEIPQSQTADKPEASRGRATQQSRDTGQTNKAKQPALSFPYRDDCKTRMYTK